MDTSGGNSERLLQLLSLWTDGLLADEQFDELIAAASADEEARNLYVDYMFLHSMMHRAARLTNAIPPLPTGLRTPADVPLADADPPGKSPVLGFLGECFHQGASFLWKSNVFSILVTICAPIAMFLLVFALVHETPPSPMAVIARSRDCDGLLDDQPTTFYPGRNIFEQQRLVIDKGLVEIQFADGAAAVLEGPATFEILGGSAGSLTRGRLAAVVPAEARGFAIETPSARVVDLGTEFGVWVDDHGQVEAHVFGGQVEVVLSPESPELPGETALLAEGEAVRIAEADPAAKSSRIVRMSAAAEQFTRRVALSEPTILFAHRGSNDPTTEGWRLIRGKGLEPAQPDFRMGPVADDGTAAWMFHGPGGGKLAYFTLAKQEGLTRELVEEANEKGWVLRARVWMNPQNPVPTGEFKGVCHFHYRDDDRVWILHPGIDRQGNQTLVVCRDSSLGYDAIVPIPGSREQYVDYEIRYKPSSKTADVFANGRLIATDFASIDRGSPSLRFGMWTPPGEVRFASLEWGILRDSSEQRLDETSDLGGKR